MKVRNQMGRAVQSFWHHTIDILHRCLLHTRLPCSPHHSSCITICFWPGIRQFSRWIVQSKNGICHNLSSCLSCKIWAQNCITVLHIFRKCNRSLRVADQNQFSIMLFCCFDSILQSLLILYIHIHC